MREKEPFDFLGFTVRYDRVYYLKAAAFGISSQSRKLKRDTKAIDVKLKLIGHYPAKQVASELNPIIRGWMNYYKIEGVSYTQAAFRKLNDYLRIRLNRYYNRKSQRKSRLHGQEAYDLLTKKFGLIVPYDQWFTTCMPKDETNRKAVCGKPHVRFDEGCSYLAALYSTLPFPPQPFFNHSLCLHGYGGIQGPDRRWSAGRVRTGTSGKPPVPLDLVEKVGGTGMHFLMVGLVESPSP